MLALPINLAPGNYCYRSAIETWLLTASPPSPTATIHANNRDSEKVRDDRARAWQAWEREVQQEIPSPIASPSAPDFHIEEDKKRGPSSPVSSSLFAMQRQARFPYPSPAHQQAHQEAERRRRPLTALDRAFALLGLLDSGAWRDPEAAAAAPSYSSPVASPSEPARRRPSFVEVLSTVLSRRGSSARGAEGQALPGRYIDAPGCPFSHHSSSLSPSATRAPHLLPAYDLSPTMHTTYKLSTEIQLQILTHLASPFCGADPLTVLLLSKAHLAYFQPRVYASISIGSAFQLNKLRMTLALHNPSLGDLIKRLQIAQVHDAAYDSLGYLPNKFMADPLNLSNSLEQIFLATGNNLEEVHLDMFTLSALTSAGTASRLEKGALPTLLSTELSSPAALSLPTFSGVERLDLLTFGLDRHVAVQIRTALPTCKELTLRWVSRRAAAEGQQSILSSSGPLSPGISSFNQVMQQVVLWNGPGAGEWDFADEGRASFGMTLLEQRQWEDDLAHFVDAVQTLRHWPHPNPRRLAPGNTAGHDDIDMHLTPPSPPPSNAVSTADSIHGAPLDKLVIRTWPGAVLRLRKAIPDALPLEDLEKHNQARTSLDLASGHSEPVPLYIGVDPVWIRGTRKGAAQEWFVERMNEVWA